MSSEEKYAMSDEDVDLYGDLQDDGECGNEADPKIDVPEDSNLSTLDLYSELIYEDHKEEERSSEEVSISIDHDMAGKNCFAQVTPQPPPPK